MQRCYACEAIVYANKRIFNHGTDFLLCHKCWHNIIYFKRKYPMGQRRKDGKHNPNWKGGIDGLMHKIRNHPRNKQWIKNVLDRDKYTCQDCGDNTLYLHAHHIKSMSDIVIENEVKSIDDALGCPELWDIINGKALCIDCHEKTENYFFKGHENYKKSKGSTITRTLASF